MARPKSDSKRDAIISAAMEVIAEQGTRAATAKIAARAGVAHGSVFNYFDTKGDLFNAVHVALTGELTGAVQEGLPDRATVCEQLQYIWARWMEWGVANPAKRRALAQLTVSDQITARTRQIALEQGTISMGVIARASARGVLKDLPSDFVLSLVDAFAGSTMDSMIRRPAHANDFREAGFKSLWNALTVGLSDAPATGQILS